MAKQDLWSKIAVARAKNRPKERGGFLSQKKTRKDKELPKKKGKSFEGVPFWICIEG